MESAYEAARAAFLVPQGFGYIRSVEDEEGTELWALYDDCGNTRLLSSNRSAVFFFAAEHEITVRSLN